MSSTIEKKGGSKSGTTREELLQQLRARRSMLQSQLHAHETDDDDHHHHHHHHHRSASTSISNINVHDTSQHQAILSDTTLSLEIHSRSYSQIEQLPEMVKRAVSATDATSGRTPPQKGQNEVGTENDSMEAHQVVVTPSGTNSTTTTTTKKAPPPQLTFVSSQSSVDLSHDFMSSSAPSTAQTTPLGLNTSTTRTRIRQGVFAVIRAGSCVTLQSLLQNGKCRVNERDYQNCTPLHIAAHEGREDMAVILLAFGADVFAIDDRNRTPRDVAVSNRHSGLGRFLLLKMKEAALNQPVSPSKKPTVVTAGSATTVAYVKPEEEGDEAVLAPPPVMYRGGRNPLTPLIPSTTIATSEFNTTSGATRRHRRKSSDPTRSLLDLDPSEGGRERLLAKLVAEADLEEAAAKLEKSERQRREQEEEDEKVRIDKEEEEAALHVRNHHPSSHHMRTITPENASMFATTPTSTLGNNNNSVDPSQPLFGFVSALCNTCRPGWGHLSAVSPTLGFSMSPAGKSQMLLDTNNNSPPTTAIITTSPENHYHHQYTASGSALPSSICPNCFAHHVAVPSSSGGGVGMAQFSMTSHSASSSTTLDQQQQQQQHRRNISTASDDVEALQTRPRTTSMIGGSSQHNITTYPPLPITQLSSSPSATYLKYYQNSVFRTITDEQSLIICLVGLPGRGKSFISKRISRYLNWKGIPCRVFNAGDYRRRMLGVEGTNGADFFDPSNEKAKEARDQMAHMAVEDMLKFISRNPVPAVGILDATNTTVVRRKLLLDTFRDYFELPSSASGTNVNIPTSSSSSGGGCPPRRMDKARVIFIESVCNVQDIITENILRAKFGNDDFKGVQDPQAVVAEFRDRIKQYEKVYETIHEEEDEGRISFIKIVDVKQRIILHHVRRGLASKVSYFLMNLHPMAFPVFIVVPGETTGTAAGKFGGDENLTAAGKEFARKMRRFIKERVVVMMEATNSNKNTPPTTTSSTITGGGSSNANTTTAQSEQSSFKKRTTTSSSSSSSSMGLRILCATNPSAQETLRIATRVTPKTKLVWGRDRLHVDPASSTTKHHHHHHPGHHHHTNNNNSPTTTEKPSTTSTVSSSSSSSDEDGSLDASESSSSMDSLGCEDHDNVDALIKPHSSSKATTSTLLSTNNNQSAASSPPPPPQSNSNHHASVPVSTITPPSRLQKQSDLIQGVAVKSLRVLDDLNYGLVSNMSEAQISERYPKLSHQLFVDNITTTGDNTVDEKNNKSNATTPATTTAAPSLSTSASAALPPSTTAGVVAAKEGGGAKKILNYAVSFPRGESCRMCNVRLEGALFEIMRSNGPVMVIAPKVPSQGVLAFLTDVLPEKSPQLELPKHSIIEVTTKGQVVIHNLA